MSHETDLALLRTTFTPADLIAAGLPRHLVYTWRNAGAVVELTRGVYRKADAPESAFLDLLIVSIRAPRAVVCLISALAVHELTDEIPRAAQFAVARGVHPPRIAYPPAEFSRFDPGTFDVGRGSFEAAPGEIVPVYSAERAVADCVRLRHRVGDAVALRALRAYLSRYPHGAARLMNVARQVGDTSALTTAVQTVLS